MLKSSVSPNFGSGSGSIAAGSIAGDVVSAIAFTSSLYRISAVGRQP